MTERPMGDDRLDRLQDRIDDARRENAEITGTDDEPRFSDDGMIEEGVATDQNAPPG